MNTLKAIQNCFPPNKHAFLQIQQLPNKRNTLLSMCKSNDQGSDSSQPQGDANKQELLARIAMLQTQKVRLTDYLDERSAYLTQFAEDANAEFDEIGENTRKSLEEAEARIMGKLEGRMQSFEETAELNRQEIEEDEKMLEDFEDQMDMDRNEGLFFKNLTTKAPEDQLALMTVMAAGIADALISQSDWRKVAALGVILVALLSQFIFSSQ